jgi:7-cyano-7-deazaguanine synthase in queuosine biosynthesis
MQYKNENKLKIEIANYNECQNELIDAINNVANRYEKVNIIDTRFLQFIKEEIMWIKACNYTEYE